MRDSAWIARPIAVLLGPLPEVRRRPVTGVSAILLAALLTIATQIGGAVLWISWPLLRHVQYRLRNRMGRLSIVASMAVFLLVYSLASFGIAPPLASAFGRDRLPCFSAEGRPLQAVSPLFCLTNRNYARPPVHRLLLDLSTAMAREAPGTITAYLDAGFPFGDGFPMLPHLSHRNGLDVDLAFFYLRGENRVPEPAGGAWAVGYWAYAQPDPGAPQPCETRIADLRWDLDWLQPAFGGMLLDERRTDAMLRWLSANGDRYGLRKILLEPHLQHRFATDARLTRFQGCRAARHDDHLHLQIR